MACRVGPRRGRDTSPSSSYRVLFPFPFSFFPFLFGQILEFDRGLGPLVHKDIEKIQRRQREELERVQPREAAFREVFSGIVVLPA